MRQIVVYDTEYWSDVGAQRRGWHGVDDHPPLLVQLGAYKVNLDADGAHVEDGFIAYVKPRDQEGNCVPISSFLTELTQITQEDVDAGEELADALIRFQEFCYDLPLYSYGRDDIATFLVSCYVQGIQMPFSARQCHDVRQVLRHALTREEMEKNSSGTLAGYMGVSLEGHHVHDARDDARSIVAALDVLLKAKRLTPDHFTHIG